MNINTFDKAMIVLCTVMLAIAGSGAAVVAMNSSGQTTDAAPATTPTPTPSPQGTVVGVPTDVKQSVDGAKLLKKKLMNNNFDNATVQIAPDGEVVVSYQSKADNGPMLKEDMAKVAILYAEAVGVHNETGGLTVAANGVKLMVSSDAAEAYADGRIQKDAFKKTFHWSSVKTEEHSH